MPEPVAHTRLTLTLQIRSVSVHRALGDFKALRQVCGCALAPPANELNNLKETVGAAYQIGKVESVLVL